MAKKILVIDDEQDVLDIIQCRLESNGYEVIQASDGEAGFAKAKQFSPDAIVLDIMMPNVDGFKTYEWLKAAPETAGICVLFLTSLISVDEEKELCQRLGVPYLNIMAKPFETDVLLAKLKELTEQSDNAEG